MKINDRVFGSSTCSRHAGRQRVGGQQRGQEGSPHPTQVVTKLIYGAPASDLQVTCTGCADGLQVLDIGFLIWARVVLATPV